MINYHPDENLLVEYATGNLAWGISIGIQAHLQLCVECRQRVTQLNAVGGAFLNTGSSSDVSTDMFDSVWAKIANTEIPAIRAELSSAKVEHADPLLRHLPAVVQKLLPKDSPLNWHRVSSDLSTAFLTSGQNTFEVAFQRIGRGGKVVEHGHRGMEYTLVLSGSFSDESGIYQVGDFLTRRPGEVHRPTATLDQDCLCLSVVEAPVKLTGWLGWILNPFLRIHPA